MKKNPGRLHMDQPHVRDIVDMLREGATALEVAAVYADGRGAALEIIANRMRQRADMMATEFWVMVGGEDVDWTVPPREEP